MSTSEDPESDDEEGRIASFCLLGETDDDVLVYDRQNPEAWVQSTHSVEDLVSDW